MLMSAKRESKHCRLAKHWRAILACGRLIQLAKATRIRLSHDDDDDDDDSDKTTPPSSINHVPRLAACRDAIGRRRRRRAIFAPANLVCAPS